MRISPGNAQHIGARDQQQDSFGFSDLNDSAFVVHAGVVAVVADGMGGMAHGNAASQAAVRAFLNAYAGKSPRESIPQALDRALKQANSAVTTLAKNAGLEDGMGTTLVAAAVHGGSLYWISAGDSRVYLLRGGQLAKLTSDHIYANELRKEVVKGKLSRAEALGNTQRGDLTSYLGLDHLPEVDHNLRAFPIHPGESVILCSDGLYRGLTEDEIAATFRGNPQSACENLVQHVLEKRLPHQDNVTVVALNCDPDSVAKRDGHTKIALVLSTIFLTAALGLGGYWLWSTLHPANYTVMTQGKPEQEVTQIENPPTASITPPPEHTPIQKPERSVSGHPSSGRSEVVKPGNAKVPGPAETPGPSQGAVRFMPSAVEFQEQIGSTMPKDQEITLINEGREPLKVSSFQVTGPDRSDFGLEGVFCGTLGTGKSCKFTVSFTPRRIGRHEAKLTVKDESGKLYEAELTGTGIGQSPPAAPNEKESSAASPKTGGSLTQGTQPQQVTSPSASAGSQVSTPALQSPSKFPPSPESPAGKASAPAPPNAPEVELSPPKELSFRATAGGRSKVLDLTIKNTGKAPLTITSTRIDGSDKSDFVRTEGKCLDGPIEPASKCVMKISFEPKKGSRRDADGAGASNKNKRTAVLLINDNASGGPHKVTLNGEIKRILKELIEGEQ